MNHLFQQSEKHTLFRLIYIMLLLIWKKRDTQLGGMNPADMNVDAMPLNYYGGLYLDL